MKVDAQQIIETAEALARQHYPSPAEQIERLAWHVGLLNGRIRELAGIINECADEIDAILADYDKKKVHLERVK